jgi:hypothetical protein
LCGPFVSISHLLDILDHNATLILGLVWTVVLRFQIAKGGGEKESMKDVGQVKRDIMDWFSEQTKNLPALPNLPPAPTPNSTTTASSTATQQQHVPSFGALPSLPGLPPLKDSLTGHGGGANAISNSSSDSDATDSNNNANPDDDAASGAKDGSEGDAVPSDDQQAQQHVIPSAVVEPVSIGADSQPQAGAQLQHAKSGNLFGTKSIDRLLINLINSLALNSIKESEITVG